MANTDKLFQKAEKLLQKRKFASALQIFLDLYEREPHNEAVLLNLAELTLRLERAEESLDYYRRLADLYTARKDVSRAIVTCRRVLKSAPDDTQTRVRLALLLKQSGKRAESAETFREAAEVFRRKADASHALDCLRHLTELEPDDLEAQIEFAELAEGYGEASQAATALLRASEIARGNGKEARWEELAQGAHELDSSNKAARVSTAEVCLLRDRDREAVALLEPVSQVEPDNPAVLKLLCRAYLRLGEYTKAGPLCLSLYQRQPETIGLTEQLIRGLLGSGETAQALQILEGIKEQMYGQQEKRSQFLALAEQIYHADENNLDVLELLPPLYNEFNREGELRLALARLFNLYLAGERYDKAADTLESVLDVDPYGAAHADRLLNLEGHIDATWYNNIASRISLPTIGRGLAPSPLEGTDEEPAPGTPEAIEGLVVEAEMYHRYHLDSKLEETLKKINRLYPEAHAHNEPLSELYKLVGFHPAPSKDTSAAKPGGREGVAGSSEMEELGKISAISSIIHRQETPERVLSVAAEQLGRLMAASRCWVGAGQPDHTALTAEYVTPGLEPSDPASALAVWSLLAKMSTIGPEGRALDDVSTSTELELIAPHILQLDISSFLAVPLMDGEQKNGLLLVEQCQQPRRWTDGERVLAQTVASQVAIAINSARLRRLVRSFAVTDTETGLLPRSAYLDCLLAEARRAEEQSRPLSVCLMEPANSAGLSKAFGEANMQSYIRQAGVAVSSHLRQNDIAIRYGPYTFAMCLPDTPLAQSLVVVEKLRAHLRGTRLGDEISPDYCATVSDLFLGPGFDAVDAVTEIINRLDTSLDTLRKQSGAGVLLSRFGG